MIRNALLTFYRINTRHPLYAAIDLMGLSLGIAVFVTLGLYIRIETSFEQWLPGLDHLDEIETRYTMPGQPRRSKDATTAMLLGGLRDDYPDLQGVRIRQGDVSVHKGDSVTREEESLVDAGFFSLFPLVFLAGDRQSALSEPGSVVLSQSMARKYGKGLGTTIRLDDEEGGNLYKVTGILADLPRNTDFKFDIVRPFTPTTMAAHPDWENWGRLPVQTYVKFADSNLDDYYRPDRDRSRLFAIGAVGAALIGCLGLYGIAVFSTSRRLLEVAVRKVLGASRRAISNYWSDNS